MLNKQQRIQVKLQAPAKEGDIYEKMTLNIELDMKRITEGMIWASCWSFSQGKVKEDQGWIQTIVESVERLGWKMMYQGSSQRTIRGMNVLVCIAIRRWVLAVARFGPVSRRVLALVGPVI
jgi:hypothetical protein